MPLITVFIKINPLTPNTSFCLIISANQVVIPGHKSLLVEIEGISKPDFNHMKKKSAVALKRLW